MWYRRENYNDVRVGDMIEVFEIIEINVPSLNLRRLLGRNGVGCASLTPVT